MAATQRDTLRLFTALLLLRQEWGGSLVAGVGLNDAGRSLALACLAAGAAGIFVEDDPANLREAQREGCCTFTVTTLDEAVRIVKNEVRQRRAITVGLRGDPAVLLNEMVECGLQPQAFAASRQLAEAEASAAYLLVERGMRTLSGFGIASIFAGDIDLAQTLIFTSSSGWSIHEQQAASMAERRSADAALLQAATNGGGMATIASRWLRVASALFPRSLERCYWMPESM